MQIWFYRNLRVETEGSGSKESGYNFNLQAYRGERGWKSIATSNSYGGNSIKSLMEHFIIQTMWQLPEAPARMTLEEATSALARISGGLATVLDKALSATTDARMSSRKVKFTGADFDNMFGDD